MALKASAATETPEGIVVRWIEAFNARDLDAMLAYLDSDVDLRPLMLARLDGHYRGHDGVRRWFRQLERLGHEHRISLSDIRHGRDGRILATGVVIVDAADPEDLEPFCAVHRLTDDAIVSIHQYVSTPDMLEYLGLVR